MCREVTIGNQVLVVDRDGRFHMADVSDIVLPLFDRDSVPKALQIYFKKYNLRMATPDEMERNGFPQRQQRLDRSIQLPKRRNIR